MGCYIVALELVKHCYSKNIRIILLSTEDDRRQEAEQKQVKIMDKEVNQEARDSNDALVCCVENTVEDRIMDSGASFHATYCKEELERFKLRSDKVRLADDKTLDIAGVGDVVLKTFLHQRLGDMSKICMSMLASKSNVSDVRKVDIYFCKPGLRIPEEEWRGKNTSLVHLKAFGCDSFVKVKDVCGEAMKCTFIGNNSDEMRYNFQDTKSHQVIRSRDITFVDSIYGARYATNSSSLTKPMQKSQVVLVDIPENLAENDSIVAEHVLSSEITQSPGGSSDTSDGSENNGSFKDSQRSNEEYSKYEASSMEGGSET
nr:retrovirus-related Pol polyprotein from transposon TNT 1-94 [Tanacetum cinerariifolium]